MPTDTTDTSQRRHSLIEQHQALVRSVANKVLKAIGGDHDPEELVCMGQHGLVQAAQRYDPARGAAFSTFAYYRIRGAIFDGLRQTGWLSRREYVRYCAGANAQLQNRAERDPGPGSTQAERVADLANTLGDLAAIFVTSLSAQPQEPPARGAVDSLEQVCRNETRQAVRRAVDQLPERERRILQLHYFEDQTLTEAGQSMGLSKSWTSRLHARAVRLMAKQLRLAGVEE